MSDHYYSEKPHSERITSTIHCTLRDQPYTFITSSGVFSKRGIDYGTRLLIETFQEPSIDGSFLDLGCGYGPIGIALARTYPKRSVVLIDINERAVSLAEENIIKNDVSNAEAFISDGFTQIDEVKFAAIVTNPPIRVGKAIVYSLLKQSLQRLKENGELWVVVQKKQGAPSMLSYLETLFTTVKVEKRKKGYYVIRAVK